MSKAIMVTMWLYYKNKREKTKGSDIFSFSIIVGGGEKENDDLKMPTLINYRAIILEDDMILMISRNGGKLEGMSYLPNNKISMIQRNA